MNWKLAAIISMVIAAGALGWGAARGGVRGGLTPQDYVDIQELYATYARAYDTDESDGRVYAETFTPDGSLVLRDRTITGHKDLAAYSHDRDKSGPAAQHWNTNFIIRPAPGGATASVYLVIFRAAFDGKPPYVGVVSNYNDVLVKTSSGWRFKSRMPGREIAKIE
jgi:hypothetical protein